MNTNDLPPAAKLAALIEAGCAANPDLAHGRSVLLNERTACAIGFACLGNGYPREIVSEHIFGFGFLPEECARLAADVMRMNDVDHASLEEICTSLREGELAKVRATA